MTLRRLAVALAVVALGAALGLWLVADAIAALATLLVHLA